LRRPDHRLRPQLRRRPQQTARPPLRHLNPGKYFRLPSCRLTSRRWDRSIHSRRSRHRYHPKHLRWADPRSASECLRKAPRLQSTHRWSAALRPNSHRLHRQKNRRFGSRHPVSRRSATHRSAIRHSVIRRSVIRRLPSSRLGSRHLRCRQQSLHHQSRLLIASRRNQPLRRIHLIHWNRPESRPGNQTANRIENRIENRTARPRNWAWKASMACWN
jgi:hypothetical protein